MTLIYNSNDCLPYLQHLRQRSEEMYQARGYVHWYEKYLGSDTDPVFQECFEAVDSMIQEYSL